MEKIEKGIAALDRAVRFILKAVTIILFAALMLMVTANVLLRIFPVTSLHWLDEIVELCFGALVFYGAAGAWAAKAHFSVGDWIGDRLKGRRAKIANRLLIELICLTFFVVFFYYAFQITARTMEVTSVFQIPRKAVYSCMPIALAIMGLYSLTRSVGLIIELIVPDGSGGRTE